MVCFFCFGILLSRLGFFQDDWHHVFYAYWQGAAGLQRFLLADRGPFAWTIYALFFKVLGYSPAAWHWSLMLIRFLTALTFWLGLRQIWPGQGSLTAWLTLLFSIYPIFTLQPLAVAYTLHWVMYLVFMLSLSADAPGGPASRGISPAHRSWHCFWKSCHLVFIEYFSGLELCRPIFLWLLLSEYAGRDRWKKALKIAAPYLGVLLLYVVYRSSYGAIFGYDRFTPLAHFRRCVSRSACRSGGHSSVRASGLRLRRPLPMVAAVDPAMIDFSRPSTFLIFASLIGFAALAYFTFARFRPLEEDSASQRAASARWPSPAWSCVVLAMLPFWLTGFSIYQKNQLWSERLALAAMPGASMLLVGDCVRTC